MKKIVKREKGITLIALVLIVILIAILGGILINISVGNISLFTTTKNATEAYKINAAKEKLELGKMVFASYDYTIEEYVENLEKEKTINNNNITDIDTHNKNVIVDGLLFRITDDDDEDGVADGYITYYYLGIATGNPTVYIKNVSTTTSTITVTIESSFANNEKYEYYIKEAEAEESSYTKDGEQTTGTTHTYNNLTANVNYSIKVVMKVSGKRDSVAEQNAKTVTMATLLDGDIVFTDSEEGWTNQNVQVVASVNSENTELLSLVQNGTYTIETSLNDGSFTATDTQTATEYGDVIKGVISDGHGNYTGAATHTITKIDKTNPTDTAPTLTSKTTSTIVSHYEQEDVVPQGQQASELNLAERKFRLTNEQGTTGTWQSSGTFEGLTHGQTYYVQTIAQDNAGNIQLSQVLTVILSEVSNATGGTASPSTPTSGDVTVTLPTAPVGHTTRYTTDGSNPTKNSTQYTEPFNVSTNCTIKYVFSDGTNIGGAGTVLVDNIDKTTYYIYYNGTEGATHTNAPSSYKIDTETFTIPNPEKEGFEFTGWTGTGLSSSTTTLQIVKGSNENKTYTANWQQAITITYMANNGTEDMTQVSSGSPVVGNNPFVGVNSRTFSRWNTSEDGSGTDYSIGQSVNSDLTLYAIWNCTTASTFAIGDEVHIGTEDFYVLENSSSNQSTITLFAKYNLNKSANSSGHYMQLKNEDYISTGCKFSNDYYWDKSTSYDLNTYTTSSIISTYSLTKSNSAILRARDYATTIGGSSAEGRLLTYGEVESLKDSYQEMIYGLANLQRGVNGSPYYLNYWLSTYNRDTNAVCCVRSQLYNQLQQPTDKYQGVRPVITVLKTYVN